MSEHGMIIQVPRWRMAVETGHGCGDLTDDEKRLAWDYICTDQTPAILARNRAICERLGQEARERIDELVMKAVFGESA